MSGPTQFDLSLNIRAIPGANRKIAVVNKSTGKARLVDKAQGRHGFASAVKFSADMKAAEIGWEIATGPVSLRVMYFFSRPKSHFGTGKNAEILKPNVPGWYCQTPDRVNLGKCLEDALTGIVWKDDRQVVSVIEMKRWASRDSIMITVTKLLENS